MEPTEFTFVIWYTFRILFIGLVVVFLLCGIDDLFLDLVYYLRQTYHRIFKRKYIKPLTRELLDAEPEKPIVIIIPAWQESVVIRRMLVNTANVLDYKNYMIFVGTYPNDEATALEVEKAREMFPFIEMVVTPAEGPTNKADCLNWIYQGIRVYEQKHGIEFAAFVMQDAEDIVHPLWLKLVNHLVPRMDFIQLPVFPLETPWYKIVAGVYRDEFAENHTKDMRAREVLAHCLPSAGVGTALSRHTIEWLARERNNQLFDIQTLTEDYLLGILLNRMPGKKIFLQQWLETTQARKSRLTGREKYITVMQPLATREFFPNEFRAAVRQKSRWILGIGLQGWKAGWTSSLGANYCLYRDRKAILANLIVVVGYIVVLYWLGITLYSLWNPEAAIPPLVETHEPVFSLVVVVLAIFGWRILNRIASTWRIYGPLDGIMAAPRLLAGNILNFCATVLAIARFVHSKRTGEIPAWGKTSHAWPSEDQLKHYHRKLGDLLMSGRLITADQLEQALDHQRKHGGRLGEILVDMKVLERESLEQYLKERGT